MTTTNALKYRLAQQRVADGLWSVDADLGVVRGQLGRPIGSRDRDGYTVLAIDHQGKTLRGIMAHRVIWEAVHGPIPDGLEINHIVGVRFGGSNAISNLEIVTRSENMAHAFRSGLHGAIGERVDLRRDAIRLVEHPHLALEREETVHIRTRPGVHRLVVIAC